MAYYNYGGSHNHVKQRLTSLGQFLYDCRLYTRFNLRDAASILKVTTGYLGAVERGKRIPMSSDMRKEMGIRGNASNFLDRCANFYGVPLEKLESISDLDYMRLGCARFEAVADLVDAVQRL